MRSIRMWGSTLALAVLAATLVASGGGAAAQSAPDSHALSVEEQQSLANDAETYAEQYGISVADATARLALGDQVVEFTTQVREAIASDNLAYVWVQHEPEYELHVGLKRPGQAQLPPAGDLPVRVNPTDYSLDDLHERRANTQRAARQLGVAYSASDIDVRTGSIELIFTSESRPDALQFDSQGPDVSPKRAAVASELGLAEPTVLSLEDAASGYLRLTVVPEDRIGETADVWAGLPGNICTVGYTLRKKSNGKLRVTTAAHCSEQHDSSNPPWQFAFTTMNYKGHQYGPDIDLAWYGKTGHNPLNRARDDNPQGPTSFYRPIVDTIDYCCLPANYWVCKYGVTTGKTCGNIISVVYDPDDDDGNGSNDWLPSYLRIRRSGGGDMASFGDSGGPVYRGQKAIAFVQGGISGDMVAFSVTWIPSDFEIYTG